jgi:hypothetical protein
MTDFDDDEPIPAPKKRTQKKFWTTDRIIGYSGAALALSAAFFPWYVFLNEDKFGINIATSTLSRILPDWAGRAFVSEMPAAIVNREDRPNLPRPADQIITGTVDGKDEAEADNAASAADQPFPAQRLEFHLLHASASRALIEDETGVYVVQPGSSLPDQSKVATLEKRGDEWVIVTDKGDIYGASGKRDQR